MKVDVIFCPSFGKRDNEVGLSNKFLINKILNFCKKNSLPLIIQKDCADYFSEEIKIDKIINEHRVSGKYLDTVEVVRQCVEYCTEKKFEKILVFAHPDHLSRIKKNLKKFGFEFEIANTFGCPYDSSSLQWWTRNKTFFILREIMVLFYYLIKK